MRVFSKRQLQQGGPRLSPSNMQPHSFSKRQLAGIALMLGVEEKNASLSDKKKRTWVHKCFRNRKPEGAYWLLYKELAEDEMTFYQYFRMPKHQLNYLLQKIIFVTCSFIMTASVV
jgi:hypothetical protein